MYIAVKYIGTDFTPGEVLPDDLDESFMKRMLKSGAIREVVPDFPRRFSEPEDPGMSDDDEEDLGNAEDDNAEDDNAEDDNAEDDNAEDDADDEADVLDDDMEPEPPEVDVAAALVQDEAEEKPKAARSRRGGKGK